jgi:hypothetical protein
MEKTGIGKNRPPRDTAAQNYQAPLETRERQDEFGDAIPF